MAYVLFVHSTAQVSSTLYDMATKNGPNRRDHSRATAESLRDHLVDTAMEKAVEKAAVKMEHTLNAKATKAARQKERLSKKAARAAEQLDRLSSHLEMLEVWTRSEPGGRQPRFTRDQIARIAVERLMKQLDDPRSQPQQILVPPLLVRVGAPRRPAPQPRRAARPSS